MVRVFLLLLVLVAPGIQASHVYEVRMAGYADDQVDDKGKATYGKFVHAFRTFPWAEQVGKAEGGAEPSIKVNSIDEGGASLFVSVIGQPASLAFVVGIIYPKTLEPADIEKMADRQDSEDTGVKDAGAAKVDKVRWAEVFVVKSAKLVERYAEKYFAGDIDALLEFMRKAPPFLSGEARLIPNLGE